MDSTYSIVCKNEEIRKIAEAFKLNMPAKRIEERIEEEAKINPSTPFTKLKSFISDIPALETDKNWVKISDKNGFGAYWKEGTSGVISIKSVGEFPDYNPLEMAAILGCNEIKPIYNKQFKGAKLIEETKTGFKIGHIMFKGKFPVKQRDFVVASGWDYNPVEKSFLMLTSSIVDSRVPKNNDYERAAINYMLYHIKPNGKNGSIATYMANIDVQGSIPGFIKNWAAKKQSSLLENLQKSYLLKLKK